MCTPEAPCLNVRRQVLLTSTFRLEECGNGHRFRIEFPWAGGVTMTRPLVLKTELARCAYCGREFARRPSRRRRQYCRQRCQAAALRAARARRWADGTVEDPR